MDSYTACSIVEGFSDEPATPKETLEAWAYLIKTGQCWSLQGWYGRSAASLIENGYISKTGKINWNVIEKRHPDIREG
jgi:hypothetical protein